jgi:hypothetical protein
LKQLLQTTPTGKTYLRKILPKVSFLLLDMVLLFCLHGCMFLSIFNSSGTDKCYLNCTCVVEKQTRLALIDFLRGLVEFDPAKRWSPFQVVGCLLVCIDSSFKINRLVFMQSWRYKRSIVICFPAGFKTPFYNWGTFYSPLQTFPWDPLHCK